MRARAAQARELGRLLLPQAPAVLQKLGLEWAFRLVQEPRRLWRRYLRYNPRFVLGFAHQYVRHLRDR